MKKQKREYRRRRNLSDADKWLLANGYSLDGSLQKEQGREQKFFEGRILMTPMGNRMR